MHNPLRSEADAFRWIVVIGITAASVIVLTLLTRPAIGVTWAAALVGFGAGVAWRSAGPTGARKGGSLLGLEGSRTLVLADDGVDLKALLAGIERRGAAGEIFLIVPRPGRSPEAHPGPDAETELARQRLELLLQGIEETGRRARGRLADPDPGIALIEALREFGAAEVVVVGLDAEAAARPRG
jgi:hypothetical protein